ncbi:hypothetical protein [Nodularia sp. NIES-3585]|uniref:hypothetical protein n=1 Tax=Nodularia sp. NIES-3585 TaxID=1973477 RepID=UPI000B5C66C4|nr:hypothetical protein [Nodularia sp. NIES-3585]GAX38882.1 hypothetical protein NIES3585_49340 [Nodularia sp. NIES-3585]
MTELVEVSFELITTLELKITLDRETYHELTKEELKAIAIAKAKKSGSLQWECNGLKAANVQDEIHS